MPYPDWFGKVRHIPVANTIPYRFVLAVAREVSSSIGPRALTPPYVSPDGDLDIKVMIKSSISFI